MVLEIVSLCNKTVPILACTWCDNTSAIWDNEISDSGPSPSPSSSWTVGLWGYVTGASCVNPKMVTVCPKQFWPSLHLPTSVAQTECHLWQAVFWRTSQAISLILFWNRSICTAMFVTCNVSFMSESLRWLKTVITLQGPWFVRRVFLKWVCDNCLPFDTRLYCNE